MSSNWESIVMVIVILGASAIITHLFARVMYLRCPRCGTLNARRRIHCRNCEWELRRPVTSDL